MSEPSAAPDRLHQIGEVAEAIGLSIRTIRHYHDVGLVPPSGRTGGGFRLYTDSDIARLQLIKQMKPLGFTLEEMAELLGALEEARNADSPRRDPRLAERLAVYAEATETRCAKLRAQLAAGEALARTLQVQLQRG
ncbi:MerR family transcriptional regulator [Acidiferrimicrobium sp. IK]|uniref:MerR family transcriptional regulator n=1 Tax=Acidiferrimicrobium sp. IK TaxID=2871700 RepID=UPI0021CB2129|nr:MerR family transcriptional regulator [Acidiferrimicrobium sp. IK]MCU4185868.1 MerR family transcriptional regulator [Acidiferrimicrobium sp. IK]